MKKFFHASIEGAQHGAKLLSEFLDYAKKSGAAGAQPSNFMLEADKANPDAGFMRAEAIRQAFADRELALDGISAHCPFWVHTTAWTGSKTIRPFIPTSVAALPPDGIEQWEEEYILRLLDLAAELGIKILPMFWGTAFGLEVASGYPWGFWKGPGYDLLEEGKKRFVEKTAKIRAHANELGIYLAHEIHPGTAAMCADDFNVLVNICNGDKCVVVNFDPSHCWEGESWQDRLQKVGPRVYGAHVKNIVIRPGMPLRMMESAWPKRGMQFVDLPSGEFSMIRYAEALIEAGYPARYRKVMGRLTAPLVVEAESAYRDLDACSANGIAFVRDNLCFPVAESSFEDGMGAAK